MGLTREQVLQYYVKKYGSQEPLAMPIDSGFNRLAWFLPYVLGASGALILGVAAIRWSRRQSATTERAGAATEATDPELEARLDDELRDLD
jgi:cytochrome c-type biogenesis protein CcmH/NrfF